MNTEFQWRSELRKLNDEIEPARDLWPAIAARMSARSSQRARAMRVIGGLAATLVVALGAGFLAQRAGWLAPRGAPQLATTAAPGARPPVLESRTPLSWAVPTSPTLAAAAHDLDGASADLQRALERHPDAVFLVGLLNRTNGQRMRLLRSAYPG